MNENTKAKLSLILSMFIFGTIGIFRKYVPLSSGLLAISRGYIGALFLILLIFIKKDKNLSKLSENAIDALTSLCYNIGIGAFKRSKCYKAIVANDLETVCKEWDWFKANGKFMKGLARRRIAELGVFLENV